MIKPIASGAPKTLKEFQLALDVVWAAGQAMAAAKAVQEENLKDVFYAIARAGMTLHKTQHGYELRNMGRIEALTQPPLQEQLAKAKANQIKAHDDWNKANDDRDKANADCDKADDDWNKASAEVKRVEQLIEEQK